jgi:serine/threonine protein kinase
MFIANATSIAFFNSSEQDASVFRLSPMKQINKYSLVAKIGSGSSSSVYLGINTESHEPYAIKRFNLRKLTKKGDAVAQLEREIRLMRLFSHPNILRLVEVLHLPSSDDVYLVLEYAAKGCLGAFLDRGSSYRFIQF